MARRTSASVPPRGRSALVLVLGFVSSCVWAVYTWSSPRAFPEGMPAGALLEKLAGSHRYQQAVFVAALAALVAMLWCWYQSVRWHRSLNPWFLLVAWGLPLLAATGGDVFNYAEQGWSVLQGQDPTLVPAGSVAGPFQQWTGSWAGTTVGYPTLAVSALMVALAGAHPFLTLLMLHLPAVLGTALLLWGVGRLARAARWEPRQAAALAVLNPLVLTQQVGEAHNDVLAAAVAVLGVLVWHRIATAGETSLRAVPLGRQLGALVAGGAVLGLALSLKPTAAAFAVLVAGLVQAAHWRHDPALDRRHLLRNLSFGWTALPVLGVAALVQLLPPLVLGFGGHWATASGTPGFASASLPRRLESLGQRYHALHVLNPVFAHLDVLAPLLVLVVALAVLLVLQNYSWFGILGIGLTALFVLGPASYPWYFVWALVPVALFQVSVRTRIWWIGGLSAFFLFPTLPVNPAVQFLAGLVFAALAIWWLARAARRDDLLV